MRCWEAQLRLSTTLRVDSDPITKGANARARRLVADALLIPLTDDTAFTQETIMAKQDAFTPEEWTQLRLAPSLVAGGVAAADPSGIFASIREAASGAQMFAEALKSGSGLELFTALAADRSMPAVPDRKTVLGEHT